MLGRALTLTSEVILALGVQILIIILLAWLVTWLANVAARRIRARLQRPEVDPARRARLDTLLTTAVRTVQLAVWVAAVLMALAVVGINIAPIIATVGVAGLAISLGAQTLIKDFIGGFLILIEDQFHAGDVIQKDAIVGTVERIDLRATYLRDEAGKLWIIPNGEVRVVSNQTREWARAVVDLTVPVDTDMAAAMTALREAGQRAAQDDRIRDVILEEPQVQGWMSSTVTTVQVRMQAKTQAGQQAAVGRVLREYGLNALRAQKIQATSGNPSAPAAPPGAPAPEPNA